MENLSPGTGEQVAGYLKIPADRYQMIEKNQPVFAGPKARRRRYYIRDNFLRSWLSALASPVAAVNFRAEKLLVEQADERLREAEGFGLERLVGGIYPRPLSEFDGHVARFLEAHPALADWKVERVAIAPTIGQDVRATIEQRGFLSQDLRDRMEPLT